MRKKEALPMDPPPFKKMNAHVLYVDHAGHPAPLTECYHATASRRVASSAQRFPASTVSWEVESSYCPNCLLCHDYVVASSSLSSSSSSATTRTAPYCPRPTCQRCPVCLSAVGIAVGANAPAQGSLAPSSAVAASAAAVHYRCGTCDWNSLECNLFVLIGGDPDESSSGGGPRYEPAAPDRLQLTRAAEDLVQRLVGIRKTERSGSLLGGEDEGSPACRHFRNVSKMWEETRRALLRGDLGGGMGGHSSSTRRRRRLQSTTSGLRVDTTASDPARSILGGWSVADLEATLDEKKKKIVQQQHTTIEQDDEEEEDAMVASVERLSLSVDGDVSVDGLGIDPSLRDLSITAFQEQVLQNGVTVTATAGSTPFGSETCVSRKDLLPLPVRLRARKSRRCRAELRDGRAGILLKPRLNPLEGDSSLRSGHGQWWKKDSSAIHVLPNVSVVRCVKVPITIDPNVPRTSAETSTGGARGGGDDESADLSQDNSGDRSNDNRHRSVVFALLRVSNPTLGSLRFRFASSSYRGELDWDAVVTHDPAVVVMEGEADHNYNDGRRYTDALPGLLVHTFTQTHWDVEYDSGVLRDLAESETIELHSAEDSIIEMGSHRAHEIPAEVVNWRPTPDVDASSSPEQRLPLRTLPHIQLVTRGPSSAWFELAFVEPERFLDSPPRTSPPSTGRRLDEGDGNSRTSSAYAVSLRLEVEVGPGTWESSLIQPRTSKDEGFVDRVPFDLVLAYQ